MSLATRSQVTLRPSHKQILFINGRANNQSIIFLGNQNPPEIVRVDYNDGRTVEHNTGFKDEPLLLLPLETRDIQVKLEKQGFTSKQVVIRVETSITAPDLAPRITLPINLKIRENDTGLIFDINTSNNVKIIRLDENTWRVYFDDSGQGGLKDWSMNDVALAINQESEKVFRVDVIGADSSFDIDILFNDEPIIKGIANGNFARLGENKKVSDTPRVMDFDCSQVAGANLPIIGLVIQGLCHVSKPFTQTIAMKFDEFRTAITETLNTSLLVNSLDTINKGIEDIRKFFNNPLKFLIHSITSSSNLFDDYNIIALNQLKPLSNVFDPKNFNTDIAKSISTKTHTAITSSPLSVNDVELILVVGAWKPLLDEFRALFIPKGVVSFEDAQKAADRLIALTGDISILVAALSTATSVIPRLARVLDHLTADWSMLITTFGFGAVANRFLSPAIRSSIERPLEQGYNEQAPTELPQDTELINEVVKEILTVDAFKAVMRKKGFAPEVSQRIFDAHFDQPALDFMVTALNRNRQIVPNDNRNNEDGKDLLEASGIQDTESVYRAMRILDFDPRFNDIWVNRFFRDPSVTEARFLFEAGAIDENGVKEILKRNRLLPSDIEGLTKFITEFRSRFFERQILLTLRIGFERGTITEDELRTKVREFNFTDRTADLIVERANLNIRIRSGKAQGAKVKLLTVSQIEELYLNDVFIEQDVRDSLEELDYEPESIDELVTLFNKRKTPKPEEPKGFREITFSTVLRLLKLNLINRDQAITRLVALRYTPEDSSLLVNLIQPKVIEESFTLMPLSTILKLYKNSTIDRTIATAKLTEKRFRNEDINLLLDSVLRIQGGA